MSHEPVLDYALAAEIRRRFGLTGVESKSLFLRLKSGGYCMYVTIEGKRADFDRLKEVLGCKVSVASQEELQEQTGCRPFCAVPFGHSDGITLVVGRGIFQHDKFLYSPGPPEKTIEIGTSDVRRILEAVKNRVVYV